MKKYLKIGKLSISHFVPALLLIIIASALILSDLSVTNAAGVTDLNYKGLVQCDGVTLNAGEIKCDFARLIFQINYLIDWFIKIMFVFLTLMIVYAGYLYILGMQDSIKKAKTIMKNVLYGVFFILAAYTIVTTITKLVGAEEYVTSLLGK